MNKELSIIIVNYNTKSLLQNCLKMIYKAHIKVSFEIIVLDNASKDSDSTIEMLKHDFKEVITIQEKTNTGYTKGVNTCVKRSCGEFIFNLNSDVMIQEGDLEGLISFMEADSTIGLVGPKLLNFDGSTQNSCFQFLTPEIALYRRTLLGKLPYAKRKVASFLMQDNNWNHSSTQEVDWILGAAFMVKRSTLDEIGHLDERMILYLSDTDFAWNLWKKNYRVIYFPEVKMYHYHRKSSADNHNIFRAFTNRAFRTHIQDGLTFFIKHFGEKNPRNIYYAKRNKTN